MTGQETNQVDCQEQTDFLSLVGGFEKYQDLFYQAITDKIKKLPEEEVLQIEESLRHSVPFFNQLRCGLKDGLVGLVKEKKYLTADNIGELQGFLELYDLQIAPLNIPKEKRSYWEKKVGEVVTPFTGPLVFDEDIYSLFRAQSDGIVLKNGIYSEEEMYPKL